MSEKELICPECLSRKLTLYSLEMTNLGFSEQFIIDKYRNNDICKIKGPKNDRLIWYYGKGNMDYSIYRLDEINKIICLNCNFSSYDYKDFLVRGKEREIFLKKEEEIYKKLSKISNDALCNKDDFE